MKNHTLTSITLLVLIIALLAVFAAFHRAAPLEPLPSGIQDSASVSASTTLTKLEGPDGITCFDSAKYFAVEAPRRDEVGSDILVKYKSGPNQSFACRYDPAAGDFAESALDAQYFMLFTENFMIVDQGTAPQPRGISAYDLRSRSLAFSDSYSGPVTAKGDTITYWMPAKAAPDAENCPSLAENAANGLGSLVEHLVSVDLLTLSRKDSGQMRCIATQ